MDEQLKEHSRSVDHRFEEQTREIVKFFEESEKAGGVDKAREQIVVSLSTDGSREFAARTTAETSRTDKATTTGGNFQIKSFSYTPKLEFPKFDGSGVRNWIKNV